MSVHRRLSGKAGVAALSLALVAAGAIATSQPSAAADDSYFFGLVRPTPMVHVPMAGAESEAQLIRALQSEGYSDIKVTSIEPNIFDPRPELMHPDLTYSSAADPQAQHTPIHFGWNGTAVKGGEQVEVYVVHAAP